MTLNSSLLNNSLNGKQMKERIGNGPGVKLRSVPVAFSLDSIFPSPSTFFFQLFQTRSWRHEHLHICVSVCQHIASQFRLRSSVCPYAVVVDYWLWLPDYLNWPNDYRSVYCTIIAFGCQLLLILSIHGNCEMEEFHTCHPLKPKTSIYPFTNSLASRSIFIPIFIRTRAPELR